MSLRLTRDHILVLPDTVPVMQGPLHVISRLPVSQGFVMAVGPGALRRTRRGKFTRDYAGEPQRDTIPVRVGSRISFRPFSGVDLIHDGRALRLIKAEDVLLMLDLVPEHES